VLSPLTRRKTKTSVLQHQLAKFGQIWRLAVLVLTRDIFSTKISESSETVNTILIDFVQQIEKDVRELDSIRKEKNQRNITVRLNP
jgi:hypothetical protein